MAKNTSNSAFRKIDIDQYDEENYKDEDQNDPQSPPVGPDENEINSLLTQYPLTNIPSKSAPMGSKNQVLKDAALNTVLRVLLSIKTNQMDEVISSLDKELIDILMKYIYRGFENPSEGSSGHLLTWHEKTFAIAGVGSIVRVLTDKKRV
uniref:Actin-related protein 2/3 complex subunit 5 n=1 Tax=Strigamia maritima TaxID=126957 RepID=T1IVN3_STRMM